MSVELLQKLRDLRTAAHALAATVEDDHASFAQTGKPRCYFRLPSKPLAATDRPSVSPTCTAWMALCAARKLPTKDKGVLQAAFIELLSQPWDTGRLKQNNAFTVAIVARAVGHLCASKLLDKASIKRIRRNVENFELDGNNGEPVDGEKQPIPGDEPWRACHDKSIVEIIDLFLQNPDDAMELDPFPASPAIGYWFIDAASVLPMKHSRNTLGLFGQWASLEFRRQHSLVASRHQSMMDPVALAMAACMCKAVLSITKSSVGLGDVLQGLTFPSELELEAGVKIFFEYQNPVSGVWEKYFPIFQYPASGPNHCWHFEVLEAVIGEFPSLLLDEDIVRRLSLSLDWLRRHRLVFSSNGKMFSGWNAGGDVKAMRRGEPESWPTGVAHMFLARLGDQLSRAIRGLVLEKYGRRVQGWTKVPSGADAWKSPKKWNSYLDFRFEKAHECKLSKDRDSVKKLVDLEILAPAEKATPTGPSPHMKLVDRHSAVLFGPPGTAKTSLCKAIAKRLGWPFVELSPSDFLGGGLEGIYHKVSEVFEDMLDLYGVVVLFDEMDALVQNRASDATPTQPVNDDAHAGQAGQANDQAEALDSINGRQLDVTQLLLTTCMLPKLADLHEASQNLYFMATNYIDNFDNAIIRSGRFDLLVHVGPPSADAKIGGLKEWCCDEDDENSIANAINRLNAYLDEPANQECFARFTYGETRQFLYALCLKMRAPSVSKAILRVSKNHFVQEVQQWANSRITLKNGSDEYRRFQKHKKKTCIQ